MALTEQKKDFTAVMDSAEESKVLAGFSRRISFLWMNSQTELNYNMFFLILAYHDAYRVSK